jgi:PTS system nitrogen regulatory IIA component
MDRERLGSTGIGEGIGIPHGKMKSLESLHLGIGVSRQGIEFESIDGKPVHICFLLVTPENSTGLHLRLLARISRILKNEPFREKLLEAGDRDAIYEAIRKEDEEF